MPEPPSELSSAANPYTRSLSKRARLPGKAAINRTLALKKRIWRAAEEAREFNARTQPDQQEEFYLASMNLIAERIYHLARNIRSKPEELRIYLELFLKHREQKIKEKKVAVMLRHIELLEQKRKALEDAVRKSCSDTELGEYVRKILGVEKAISNNGHRNHNEAPRLLENGFAS